MNLVAKIAATAGAFVVAGTAATVLNDRHRKERRLRRGEEVEFGSVHTPPHAVTATDGVRLDVEVEDGPEGVPTVVFVHGWVCTLDTWHYQRLALRGRARMVLFDQRSHGASGRSPAEHCTIEQLGEDLKAVLDAHAPSGPVVLVGHSMGGMAIMQLARTNPRLFGTGRVQGVVLASTAAGRLARNSPALRWLRPLIRTTSPVIDWGRAFNSYSIIRHWGLGPDAPERYADMSNEMILRAPTRVLLDFYPLFIQLDLLDHLGAFKRVTTRILCGTEDLLTPPKQADRLAEAVPDARLELLPGVGHMLPFEAHEVLTKALEDVLEEVEA